MHKSFWMADPFSSLLLQIAEASTTFFAPGRNDTAAPHLRASAQDPQDPLDEAYSVFVPPNLQSSPPLLVMLHGGGQSGRDFELGTGMNDVAARNGFIVLYPEQSHSANPARCWNWFDPAHQTRSKGEPARLLAMTLDIARRYHVDQTRMYVAGLSAGGAMAALLGKLFPEIFAAVGVHSGLPACAASDLTSALNAMRRGTPVLGNPTRMPTIVFHGEKDDTVSLINAAQVVEAALGQDHPYEMFEHACADGRRATGRRYRDAGGHPQGELWILHDAAHTWSGGRVEGSFTDPGGPKASEEMWRFFKAHRRQ